ncbi:MAG: peptidoglycan DD-metalloendopeptidase family protein [Alphaproteobacteria bacterium]
MIKKTVLLCVFLSVAMILFSGCGYDYLSSLKPRIHTVRSSETVYAISRKYNVPIRTIIEQNNLEPPYMLKKGQKLEIPRAPIHTVKKGETLYSVARKYDVNLNTLIKKNKLRKPYTLSVGQKLYLPADFNKITYAKEEIADTSKTQQKTAQQIPEKSQQKQEKKQKKAVVQLPDAPKRAGKFMFPVQGTIISGFGVSGNGRRNDGINISAKEGTAFKSVENGVIAYAGNELKGFGNLILVKHSDGWISAYAHAKDIVVKKGATVKRGDVLGHVGSTGNVKAPQLHFEIRKGTKAVDPMNYLKK